MRSTESTSTSEPAAPVIPPRRPRWQVRLRNAGILLLLIIVGWLSFRWWTARGPQPATEIYHGVTYACERLTPDEQGSGLMHWIRIDLNTPGIEIFTTPLDYPPRSEMEYRLRYTSTAVKEHDLAAAVNGTLYRAGDLPLPGRPARSAETVVSEHVVNHVDRSSFLLWFEDDMTPHMEATRPPGESVLRRARFGIGGNVMGVHDGAVTPYVGTSRRDSRTWLGLDPHGKLLWMAVFDDVTERRAAVEMSRLGATEAIPLDGGSSTEMVLGADARRVRPGAIMQTWIPNATHFGIRAQPFRP